MFFHSSIKEIEAPELARWLDEQADRLRVIDVRQVPEIAAGTVPGAEAVPLHTLPLKLDELDREAKLVLVCRSGARSAQACMFLAQQGFENVYNLRGGMLAWAQTGQAIGLPQAS
jgi:rhodanese-related sulfurtransferase